MPRLIFPALLALVVLLPAPDTVMSAEQAKKKMPLWSGRAPLAQGDAEKDRPSLTLYPVEDGNGCGVVVCPGGGYGHLAVGHEGKEIAEWFNSFGVAAFVLRYRIAPYRHPAPLTDVQRAVRTVRSHAKEWNVDPDRIGIIGFSAGGHLVSSLATHFDAGKSDAEDAVDRASCRPDFVILGYPVITLTEPYTHAGSRRNLLGENPDPQTVELLSNERQVTGKTPPTFLLHTTEDRVVPPENSILFYSALRKAGVPAELHIFEKGRHGLGLARNIEGMRAWPDLCRSWMKTRGVLDAK